MLKGNGIFWCDSQIKQWRYRRNNDFLTIIAMMMRMKRGRKEGGINEKDFCYRCSLSPNDSGGLGNSESDVD